MCVDSLRLDVIADFIEVSQIDLNFVKFLQAWEYRQAPLDIVRVLA